MRLEAEKLLGGDGEYAVDFVKPGWLAECRKTGGTFLLYPQTSVDALAAQRDEGLAREAELHNMLERHDASAQTLHEVIGKLRGERDALQKGLAEAKRLLVDVRGQLCGPDQRAIDTFLASSGCADGEKAPAPSVNLPRRKVKTEYSTVEEDAQADAWNAALDAVQELNR